MCGSAAPQRTSGGLEWKVMACSRTASNVFWMARGFTKQAKFVLSHTSGLELLSCCYYLLCSAVSVIKKAVEGNHTPKRLHHDKSAFVLISVCVTCASSSVSRPPGDQMMVPTRYAVLLRQGAFRQCHRTEFSEQ